jgi:hypothetical protein
MIYHTTGSGVLSTVKTHFFETFLFQSPLLSQAEIRAL